MEVITLLNQKTLNQKTLKQRYQMQHSLCECGYPMPIDNVTILEGFFTYKRVFTEYVHVCKKCGKQTTRIK